MSTTHRWTKDAILARLEAAKAIDSDTIFTARERAERRLDLVRVSTAVDDGRMDALDAEIEFRQITRRLQPLSLTA
ncbi:hypothetical protein EDF46_1889 [Frondihabitans sp. PhB188]|uniref:hypothetical protein n=1 Tax=Frondihabitans sp. PhB188 TaxID=2485200 RepID=UPI000FBE10F9|nr:hypothetical protein [Frondihabitans sp. PhB188]ROQ38263.1 hypothetical protein EDF46_1889 [Frondihabitans sp. PhB188]